MNGDKVGERAYALREAMRTHDQAGIEAALASPDLNNDNDAMKKEIARAERLALMRRVRDLDAHDRQLTAPLTGQSEGRTLEQQLADSRSDYVSSEPEIDDPSDALRVATSYKDKDTRRKHARNDQIATQQMLETGELSMATKIHRARQAGDVKGESKLMQSIGTNDELRDVRLDYLATYDELMFRGLETDRFQLMGKLVGDDDSGDIAKRIALEAESTEELRMRQIGERGVLAQRSATDQVDDQRAINDKTESDSVEFSEQLRLWRGGNYGTQDLMRAGHDRVARMIDTETGQLRDGVTTEQLARANETLVASQELQGAEKQKHAEEAAAVVGTMIRLGALFVPGAYPLLNLAANLSGMAIKGEIEGADYKHRQNADWVNTGTSLAADLVGVGAGKLATAGKISQGAAIGTGTVAQIGAAVTSSTAAGDTSEQTGGTALNVALGSFLPFLGKAAGGVIKGSSLPARIGRVVVDSGVQAGVASGLNGGQGGLLDVVDAVGGAAGDHLGGGGPHPRRRTPTAEDHRNASGHYAEDDGPSPRRPTENDTDHSRPSHDGDSERTPSTNDPKAQSIASDSSDEAADRSGSASEPPSTGAARDYARARQAEANARREARVDPDRRAEWKTIQELKHAARTPEDFAEIRRLEEEYDVRLSERTPATEGSPRGAKNDNAEHEAALLALRRETEAAIKRDLDDPMRELIDEQLANHTGDGVPEVQLTSKVSLGMGGAGSAGAAADPMDRMGIENLQKQELWRGLEHKRAGQSPYDVFGYGTESPTVYDFAMDPYAEPARASELALQVAVLRQRSGVGTIGNEGPVRALEFNPTLDEASNLARFNMGVPLTLGGRNVMGRTDRIDIATGVGPARDLQTQDGNGRKAQLTPEHLAYMREKKMYITGEDALARDPSLFAEKEVLGIGGGPTSVWAMEHAKKGGAWGIEIAGQMPRIADPDLAQQLATVRAQIDANLDAAPDVMAPLTAEYHRIYEQHVQRQLAERNRQQDALDDEYATPRQKEKAQLALDAISADIDPFLGSRLERNEAMLNDTSLSYLHADVLSVEPAIDPTTNTERVRVTYADGTRRFVDQVVPSIGSDPNGPGGLNNVLSKMPEKTTLLPVIADGRVVGLESQPAGITISGAALTGTLGYNMPPVLLSKIPAEYRDAVLINLVDHAKRESVSPDSYGIVPGIESVGDAPARMQTALQLDELARHDPNLAGLSQNAEREAFLDKYRRDREAFGNERRYSDRTLMLGSGNPGGR